jgi:acetyl-CoA carboxylase carboxyltransferase component
MRSAVTGETDKVTESDEEAIDAMRRYLTYLPDHNRTTPERAAVPAGSDEAARGLLDIVPEARSQVYDVRKVIEAVVDKGSFCPVKERFAKVAVTGFARIDGRVVGVFASNPMFKGGALDPQSCLKMTSFVVLCDSFNIPMVFFTDTPGFLVGVEGERQGLAGKIMNFIQALEMSSVPKFAIILRKSYGQAYLNMGGKHDQLAAWYTADVSFMDPDVGVNVVYGVRADEDPERFAELRDRLARDTTGYDLAAGFYAKQVIDPRETRDYLKRQLAVYQTRPSGGIGEHRLRYWPTTF